MHKHQAVVMATSLFNLGIADHSSVKELDGYDDRNFYMRGSLNNQFKELDMPACEEYVLKIINHQDSNNECLMKAQCDVMLFLQSHGYKCPIPVPSIFDTSYVKCKIPRRDVSPESGVWQANGAQNLEYGIEIYDGEEYSEEEYFVCAVRLHCFVPGKPLNEIPLSSQLLFDAGLTVGRLDQDLKVMPGTMSMIRKHFG